MAVEQNETKGAPPNDLMYVVESRAKKSTSRFTRTPMISGQKFRREKNRKFFDDL